MAATWIPQFKEGDAGTTGTDFLVPMLGRRNDSDAAHADTDGDYGAICIDSAGRIRLGASTAVIGHVIIDSGAIVITPSGTQDVNLKQVGGATFSLGQQLAAASLPVVLTAAQLSTLTPLTTVAVTNTGTFAVQATLAAETTKVIGTVNIAASQTIAVTNTGTFVVQAAGTTAHDAVGTSVNPLATGGYASAAAPTDVSADGDIVRSWHLRNGAQATVITAAGALIGGDATNGLDVDVTRMSALVAGSAVIGKVGIDQTTPGTTNLVALSAETTKVIGTVNISAGQTIAVTNAGTFATQPAGSVAHDGVATGVNPLLVGGYASAAAPSDVSADGDSVRAWNLRNGARATVITAAGALIGGDAANGLDVDVTRLSALVAGSAVIGKVGIDQTTPGTTNLVALTAETTKVIGTVNIAASQTIAVTNAGTFATQPAGSVAHDGVATSVNPVLVGGYASAAAPSDVSADGDSVRAWNLRNGARAVVITAAGALIGATSNALDTNVKSMNGVAVTMGNGVAGTGVQRVTLASDSTGNIATIGTSVTPGTAAGNLGKAEDAAHASGDTGVAVWAVRDNATSGQPTTAFGANGDYCPIVVDDNYRVYVQGVGNVAHDGVDAGAPVKVGMRAIAHGTNPTAVAAADRTDWFANRAGVPFVIGGHPNIQTVELVLTTARSDTALFTVASGLKVVVTAIEVVCSNANSVSAGVRIGFGTSTVPTVPTDGNTVAGMILTHPKIAAGSGVVLGNGAGIVAVGGDGEEVRVTNEVPTGGSMRVRMSYYTIES